MRVGKRLHGRLQNGNPCNSKSAWYDTVVNVHVRIISVPFRSFLSHRGHFCVAMVRQVYGPCGLHSSWCYLQLRFPVLTFGDRNAPEIYAKLRLENNVGTDACLT